jgi:hypothetical protein
LRHEDHTLHPAVQGWIDEQRDTFKEARKAAAEVEVFPAADFLNLETRLPKNGFEFGYSVKVVVDRLKSDATVLVIVEVKPVAIRQAHEQP